MSEKPLLQGREDVCVSVCVCVFLNTAIVAGRGGMCVKRLMWNLDEGFVE